MPAQAVAKDVAPLPEMTRVYYQEQDAMNPNLISIPAKINGRPINMLFDTGADGVVIGKSQLAQLGIAAPTGRPTGKTGGVGSGGSVDVWILPCEIEVGGIRRIVPVYVQDSLNTLPLLGQTFYRDLAYEIDSKAKTLVLKKRHYMTAGSENSTYNVHFDRMGRHLIVQVEVNGKPMKMIFDTGASSIAFTKEQLEAANIKIPEDAQVGTSTGVAGSTVSYNFPISRIRMGPIDRSDVPISAVSDAQMPYPLLGQTFYAGWQYTIDDEHQQIVFVRR
jgi:clan AA aspartic protease (TIGR02281 family)